MDVLYALIFFDDLYKFIDFKLNDFFIFDLFKFALFNKPANAKIF
jgi:hypothetical protein